MLNADQKRVSRTHCPRPLAQLYDLGAINADQLAQLRDTLPGAVAAAVPTLLLGTATTQRSAWDRLAADGVTGFVDRSGRS
ncbi:hypothetical protein [Saccharopolyspora tripterygii]